MKGFEPNIKDQLSPLSFYPLWRIKKRESILEQNPHPKSTFSQLLRIDRATPFLRSYFGHRWSRAITGHFYESITRRTEVWQRRRHSNISLSLSLSYFLTIALFSLFHSPAIHLVNTIPLSLSLSLLTLSIFRSSLWNDVKRGWGWRGEREKERDVRLVCNVTI